MVRLLSKAENAVFWKEDEEMIKLKGINLTPAHKRVLTHRIRQKFSKMISLLSTKHSWEYIQNSDELFEMIDRLLNRIKNNKRFGDPEQRDTLAITLKCYAFDLESEEQREKRNLEVIKELKKLREENKH